MKITFAELCDLLIKSRAIIFDRYALSFTYVDKEDEFIEISYTTDECDHCEYFLYEENIVSITRDEESGIITVIDNTSSEENKEYSIELLCTMK